MKKKLNPTVIVIFFGLLLAEEQISHHKIIMKEYHSPGRIEALILNSPLEHNLLIQLNLKNDSLFNLVNDILSNLELFSGPASYHRAMSRDHFLDIQSVLSSEFYAIIDDDYQLPSNSRIFWVDLQEGSESYGSSGDVDGSNCMCLSGAVDCMVIGFNDDWWDPLDYWGEAWWAYSPPYHDSVEEIRVTIRGAQCDALPIWSETYLGMRNENGSWSQDYELSIDYTDNIYVVTNTWSDGMLMPQVGSEDNYCVDHVKLEFFYSCENPAGPENLLASDGEDCYTVNLQWTLPEETITNQILFRDDQVIASLDTDISEYEDWGAQSGESHIYCVQVLNECGESTQSCNPGSVAVPPEAAQNVTAGDGESPDYIVVNWDDQEGVNEFKIYRDGIWLGISAGNNPQYIDLIPEFGIIYEYCIEAINDCGNSLWACDSGFTMYSQGDINFDNELNVLDVVILVSFVLEVAVPSEEELIAADMNSDTLLNVLDVVILVGEVLAE